MQSNYTVHKCAFPVTECKIDLLNSKYTSECPLKIFLAMSLIFTLILQTFFYFLHLEQLLVAQIF